MAASVPTVALNNGHSMPAIGLGTWRTDNTVLKSAIISAINAGYRHFDCAQMYANEGIIGEALAECIASGDVTRDQLFITSKIMPTDMHTDLALSALQKTLANLKLSYIDLYLLHWPYRFPNKPSAFPVPLQERLGYSSADILAIWQVLEGAVDAGLVRSLGVSNFTTKKMAVLWEAARIKPVNNQVEMHPALQQQKLVDWHAERGIVITTYCPLGSPARPAAFRHDEDPDILGSDTIASIASKHHKSPAQIALRWAYQRGTVALPKSVTPHRLLENIAIFDFKLDQQDMDEITKMDLHHRFSRGENFAPEGQTWQDIWDGE